MRRPLAIGIAPAALAGIAVIAAGCGGGNSSQGGSAYAAGGAARASHAATITTRHTRLGTVLVDGQRPDPVPVRSRQGRRSTSRGACAAIWPPLAATGRP